MKPGKHYHIRWSNSNIDWKPFRTCDEASDIAESIKKRNESYVILERDSECERCMAFAATASEFRTVLISEIDESRRYH